MMPNNQNVLTAGLTFDLVDQFVEMVVFEPVIDFETKRLGSRLCGEQGTMAIPTVLAGEDGVQLQRSPVDCEIFEIISIRFGAFDSERRQATTIIRFLGVADDQNDGVLQAARIFTLRRLRKNRRGNSQSDQRAKYQFKSHLPVPVGQSGHQVDWTLHHAKAGVNANQGGINCPKGKPYVM